jgi:hypothetical protein
MFSIRPPACRAHDALLLEGSVLHACMHACMVASGAGRSSATGGEAARKHLGPVSDGKRRHLGAGPVDVCPKAGRIRIAVSSP